MKQTQKYINVEHPQTKISLKEIEVDELMVPLVRMLNEETEILTLASCQGSPEPDEELSEDQSPPKPYILWLSFNSLETINAVEALDIGRGTTRVRYSHHRGVLEYITNWPSQKEFLYGIEILKKFGYIKPEYDLSKIMACE